jgi:hypothetical protein
MHLPHHEHFLHLPLLESPKLLQSAATVLDKFVASQLGHDFFFFLIVQLNHDDATNMFHASVNTNLLVRQLEKQEMVPKNASMSGRAPSVLPFFTLCEQRTCCII